VASGAAGVPNLQGAATTNSGLKASPPEPPCTPRLPAIPPLPPGLRAAGSTRYGRPGRLRKVRPLRRAVAFPAATARRGSTGIHLTARMPFPLLRELGPASPAMARSRSHRVSRAVDCGPVLPVESATQLSRVESECPPPAGAQATSHLHWRLQVNMRWSTCKRELWGERFLQSTWPIPIILPLHLHPSSAPGERPRGSASRMARRRSCRRSPFAAAPRIGLCRGLLSLSENAGPAPRLKMRCFTRLRMPLDRPPCP